MRDRETMSLALTAAETGHLVLSTLHTRDSKGVISRIVDMFPAERNKELATQLSFSLSLVLSQKLVTKANGQGRCAAFEVLRITPAVGHLIRSGNWHQIYSHLETGAKHGMMALERHLAQLYREGVITREEALRHANDPSIQSQLGAG
jgi:twitching motility protein PilT